MKRSKILGLLALAAMMLMPTTGCNAQTQAQLPKEAQTIVQKHFAGKQILLVKQEMEWVRRHYDVVFSDGTKIEFDSKGQWVEIDCMHTAVPAALVPQPIMAFVKKTYPDAVVTKIERDRRGYDVDLSNGLDLEFNSKYQLIDVDN
ncbi:MAG: PepSY-like domain-containing protein [Bacteroidaceae bacterium]|nr:PepSY-like domain-containing protein [Bacteroidaceae bacterium]